MSINNETAWSLLLESEPWQIPLPLTVSSLVLSCAGLALVAGLALAQALVRKARRNLESELRRSRSSSPRALPSGP